MTKLIIALSVVVVFIVIVLVIVEKTSFSTRYMFDTYLLPPDILNKFKDYLLNDRKV